MMRRIQFVLFVFLLSGSCLWSAPVCISGNSLASYEALGSTGCSIGPLVATDFIFSVLSSGGGVVPVTAADITITTLPSPPNFGLSLSSPGFSVSGSEFVTYLVGYTLDPSGDIRSASDVLDPGQTDIVTDLCVGAAFVGSSCSATPLSLHVFEGSSTQLTDSITFAPVAILGVQHNISLDANGGSASFNSLTSTSMVPEPAYGLWVAASLLVLAGLRRRRVRNAAQVALKSL
jgi:MYXO-CTERM domain-containing protein